MKNVGVLTHPLVENYGGILQAIALCAYLEDEGHHVTLLRKHRRHPFLKKLIIKLFEVVPGQNFRGFRKKARKRKIMQPFIDIYLPSKTEIVFKTQDLGRLSKGLGLDAIIVGSDQVWRMDYIDDGHFDSYFLSFADSSSIRKISYAASFGKDYWERSGCSKMVSELLSDFSHISVREKSGIGICLNEFGISDVRVVLDPTLLVSEDFYDRFPKRAACEQGAVVTYVLDQDAIKEEIVAEVIKNVDYGKGVVRIRGDGVGKIYDLEEWVDCFRSASFVITDSFHGMIFSLIFGKEFLVIVNEERGATRFKSLLSELGLESRMICATSNWNLQDRVDHKIDYEKIREKLINLREYSREFLARSLD